MTPGFGAGLVIPDLWQQEAVRALQQGKDVVVQAPTGSCQTSPDCALRRAIEHSLRSDCCRLSKMECRDRNADFSLNRTLRTDRDRAAIGSFTARWNSYPPFDHCFVVVGRETDDGEFYKLDNPVRAANHYELTSCHH